MKYTLFDVVKILFIDKSKYHLLDKKTKESFFFMINKYLSKKYPMIANSLNNKNYDTDVCLDFWFDFFKNTYSIPNWFWHKKTEVAKSKSYSNKELSTYLKYDNITLEEFKILEALHPEQLKLEVSRFIKLDEFNTNNI